MSPTSSCSTGVILVKDTRSGPLTLLRSVMFQYLACSGEMWSRFRWVAHSWTIYFQLVWDGQVQPWKNIPGHVPTVWSHGYLDYMDTCFSAVEFQNAKLAKACMEVCWDIVLDQSLNFFVLCFLPLPALQLFPTFPQAFEDEDDRFGWIPDGIGCSLQWQNWCNVLWKVLLVLGFFILCLWQLCLFLRFVVKSLRAATVRAATSATVSANDFGFGKANGCTCIGKRIFNVFPWSQIGFQQSIRFDQKRATNRKKISLLWLRKLAGKQCSFDLNRQCWLLWGD